MRDTNGRSRRTPGAILLAALAVLLASACGGCGTIRDEFRSPAYVLSFFEVAGRNIPPEQRTATVTGPDGAPLHILANPFLTAREIIAVQVVRKSKDDPEIKALQFCMDRQSRTNWMLIGQYLKSCSFAVIVDNTLCVKVCQDGEATFPQEGIIEIPGPWDPDVAECLTSNAAFNSKKHQD